jgi:N-acyl-D-amino-acid deacylase
MGLLAGAFGLAVGTVEPYDLLLRDARILDGTGAEAFRGDLAVRDGRIARIGNLRPEGAAVVLEARGRVLAPGFVDVHMHVEEGLPARPDAENLVADGVTSIVTGNCGGSELPLGPWFGRLAESGTAVNVASLIGHNSIRPAVMGHADRRPSPRELAEMELLVRRAMAEGAAGFSTGLIYVPGTFARAPELAALARAAGALGGVYATHLRNENDRVFEAIDEAIAVARSAGVPLQISHFKVTSPRLWGASGRMLEKIEDARREGLDVTLDQYPYTASSAALDVLLPEWALGSARDGARRALQGRLRSPRLRRKIARDMHRRLHDELGRNSLEHAVVAGARWAPELEGRSVREINRLGWAGRPPRPDTLREQIATVLALCESGAATGEGPGVCAVQMNYHNMSEADVERILAHPLTMVARDGGVPGFGAGQPHPRSYGTAARVLRRYVRERQTLRLEEAVRKMTSLPARRFGLRDRGILREGYAADLVLFDPGKISDESTFADPHHFSAGFDDVFVNGVAVRKDGRPTGARPGRLVYGPALDEERLSASRLDRALPLSARAPRATRR